MNKKLTGILIITAGLIAVGVIIYFMFFYSFSKEENLEIKNEENKINVIKDTQEQSIPQYSNSTKTDIKTEEKVSPNFGEENLKKMAASFAERFGSYSNHSNYSNITDLKVFMSKRMKNWADNFMSQIGANNEYSGIYYGITTRAISQEVNKFDDNTGDAEILVKTKRRESTGSMDNSSNFYQNILIKFVKETGSWKIDSADWQK